MKKTVDEIKGHMDDMKHSLDEVKSDIQVTKSGAADTSQGAKETINQAKDAAQELKSSFTIAKGNMQETGKALQGLWQREHADTPDQLEPEFEKEGTGYIVRIGGSLAGEITYTPIDEHTWVLDHTFVSPQYRGRDLAQRLLQLVAAEARSKAKKIIPSCSYAAIQFKRRPEYADVWKQT